MECWGKALLCVSEEIAVCAYRDQFPLTSEYKIANHFFLLCGKPTRWCCGDTLSEKRWEIVASANIKKVQGAEHKNWRKH